MEIIFRSGLHGGDLKIVFADRGLGMIILDRLIPGLTYATQKNPENVPAVLEYLKKNRGPKPLAAVVDGSGEDDFLDNESIRPRRAFCEEWIPAQPSLAVVAQELAHVAAYYERKEVLPPLNTIKTVWKTQAIASLRRAP